MATVTTTFTPQGRLRTFKQGGPGSPLAELLFLVPALVVPAKDAANESEVVISCSFPSNFAYRLQSLEIFAASTSLAVFDDFEKAWTATLTEAQVTTRRFGLFNQVQRNAAVAAIKIDPDSTTNDFGTWFAPEAPIGDQLIDATTGTSILTLQIMDTTSDATAATTFVGRFLATAYTIEQYNEAPINSPTWTV